MPTVRTIYAEHARFVRLMLHRFGVPPADLEDLAQDVFVVVHRRLDSFDGNRMTSWLFGICRRLAANYHRGRRRAKSFAALGAHATEHASVQVTTDKVLARRDAERALSKLSLEYRAVFTMFEIEALSGQEIAETLGIPIATVYSRLYTARKQIERIVGRLSPAPLRQRCVA